MHYVMMCIGVSGPTICRSQNPAASVCRGAARAPAPEPPAFQGTWLFSSDGHV
jgi:hypothetical protein